MSGMIGHISAEGLFTVNYSSSRLGNVATGFSLSMVGKEGTLGDRMTVEVSNGLGGSAIFGSKYGVTLTTGKSLSRSYRGDMKVVVDPGYDMFGKLIIIHEKEGDFVKATKDRDLGSIRVLSNATAKRLLFGNLMSGDMAGFIDGIIGKLENIVLDTSKANESPIIKALTESNLIRKINNSNAIDEFLSFRKVFSIGDFFSSLVAPFGLEVYWVSDNIYSVEPARLAAGPGDNVIHVPEDIIEELNISSDIYNAPDIIVPSFARNEMLGALGLDVAAKTALLTGFTNTVGSSGNRLKISTYDIPSFLMDPVETAMSSVDFKNAGYGGNASRHTTDKALRTVASFFSSYAKKSTLYRLKTGSCTLEFSPQFTQGFSWYEIAGEKVFVSDIHHTITRGSASTTLNIAGKFFDFESTDIKTPTLDFSQEEKTIADAKKKCDKHIREIKKTRKIQNKKAPTPGKSFMKEEEKNNELNKTIVSSGYSE
jgi:hypothetical protein